MHYIFIFLSLVVGSVSIASITPAELQTLLASGKPVTLIDVRPLAQYQKSHIPGAIHISINLLNTKSLPRDKSIIIYGDGLGKVSGSEGKEALAQQGITASTLLGGFSGWRSFSNRITGTKGFYPQQIPFITYQQLLDSKEESLVLVDVRSSKSAGKTGSDDLLQVFSLKMNGSRVTQDPGKEIVVLRKQKKAAVSPLFVLVGKMDGAAEKWIKTFHGNGFFRCVILAGGEQIIIREGRSGLTRTERLIHSPAMKARQEVPQ